MTARYLPHISLSTASPTLLSSRLKAKKCHNIEMSFMFCSISEVFQISNNFLPPWCNLLFSLLTMLPSSSDIVLRARDRRSAFSVRPSFSPPNEMQQSVVVCPLAASAHARAPRARRGASCPLTLHNKNCKFVCRITLSLVLLSHDDVQYAHACM